MPAQRAFSTTGGAEVNHQTQHERPGRHGVRAGGRHGAVDRAATQDEKLALHTAKRVAVVDGSKP
jgi:hypothetical protein